MKTSPFSEDSIKISPTVFEEQVKKFFSDKGHNFRLIEVVHDKKIKTIDQEYQIDVYYEFEQANVLFKVLVECKKYKGAITRELVQVLSDKISETGCHKGILVSSSGFQKGAISYAKRKGIALIRILKGEMLYESKGFGFIEIQNGDLFPETRSKEKVDFEEINNYFNFPDFSFQYIEQNGKENNVSVTLLTDSHKNDFLNRLKTWHNSKS
ncbi:MAG: restriction endonuclease [Bacteroidetes bacterium]|nr:restriction endonuclease [Bacteroidota bacterium]